MQMQRSLLKDMLSYLPAKVVPALIALVSVPVVTRLFSPEAYGYYMIVIATAAIFTNTLAWLPVSIIRFYHQYRNAGKEVAFYSTILKLSLISLIFLALLFFILLVFTRHLLGPVLYSLMRVGILVFIAFTSYNIMGSFLKARRLALCYSGFIIWQRFGSFSLGIALVLIFGFGIEGLLWGMVLSTALAFPLLFRASVSVSVHSLCFWRREEIDRHRTSSKLKPLSIDSLCFWRGEEIDRVLTKEAVSYGFPMIAGILAAWVLSLSDRFILNFFAGSAAVGIYAANYNVAERIILLTTNLFLIAGTPLAISIWENKGEEESRLFLNQLTRAFLLFVIPAVAGLSIVARPLITLFLDSAFHEGYRAIPFVAAGIFFLGLQQITQSGLLFRRRTKQIMIAALTACSFNFITNIIFIPRYGYMAAAATTLLSYLLYALITALFARRCFTWPFPLRTLARTAAAAALMVAVVSYLLNGLPSFLLPLTNSLPHFLPSFLLPLLNGLPSFPPLSSFPLLQSTSPLMPFFSLLPFLTSSLIPPLVLATSVTAGAAVYFLTLYLMGELNHTTLKEVITMIRRSNHPE